MVQAEAALQSSLVSLMVCTGQTAAPALCGTGRVLTLRNRGPEAVTEAHLAAVHVSSSLSVGLSRKEMVTGSLSTLETTSISCCSYSPMILF